MPRPRVVQPRLVAAAVAVLLAMPGAVVAAGSIDVAGTVTRDGAPVENAAVTAWIDGSDMLRPATTDANGTFTVQVEGDVGSVLQVRATGPTVSFPPDEEGCVRNETSTGRLTMTIEALPVPPVAVPLDSLLVDVVCGATATPGPVVTLPATDAVLPGAGGRDAVTGSLAGVIGLLGAVVTLGILVARRRRA